MFISSERGQTGSMLRSRNGAVREFGNWNPIFEMSQIWPISVIIVQKKVLEVTIIEINIFYFSKHFYFCYSLILRS